MVLSHTLYFPTDVESRVEKAKTWVLVGINPNLNPRTHCREQETAQVVNCRPKDEKAGLESCSPSTAANLTWIEWLCSAFKLFQWGPSPRSDPGRHGWGAEGRQLLGSDAAAALELPPQRGLPDPLSVKLLKSELLYAPPPPKWPLPLLLCSFPGPFILIMNFVLLIMVLPALVEYMVPKCWLWSL